MGKEKLYDTLNRIYNWCNDRMLNIAAVILVIWLASGIFDIISRGSVFGTQGEECFYETGDVIAISVVVWTFMMTLFMYYLGRIDERCYGIKRYESFLMDFQTPLRFYGIFGIIFGDLLVLIVASVAKFALMLICDAFILFATMLYVLVVISIKTSRRNIVEQVEREVQNGNYEWLCKMVESNSFEEEQDKIIGMLCNDLFDSLCNKDEKKVSEDVCDIAKCLLAHKHSCTEIMIILRNWFKKIDEKEQMYFNDCKKDKILTNQIILAVQKGITKAVFNELTGETYRKFVECLDSVSDNRRRELLIWARAYNLYLQSKAGQQWRELFSMDLKTKIVRDNDSQNKLLEYLKEFYKEDMKNFFKVFPYIFETR
ncbi:MAG: hypothetical protein K2N34_00940 [Lachnospiraceae bacterium]|nr:hypothetical protein [Lachnospiraceae bacterium]